MLATIHAPGPTENTTLCGQVLRSFSDDRIADSIEAFDNHRNKAHDKCSWCESML